MKSLFSSISILPTLDNFVFFYAFRILSAALSLNIEESFKTVLSIKADNYLNLFINWLADLKQAYVDEVWRKKKISVNVNV